MELVATNIVKFNPSVLKRFEQNINGGTLFLFNADNDEFWTGNNSAGLILKLVDGQNTIQDIYDMACNFYNEYDINTIINSINVIFAELADKNFLIFTNEKV